MDSDINNYKDKLEKVMTVIENNYATVRAGRVNPNMLDGLLIPYYGVLTPIKTLANISALEARQLLIKPFDKSVLGMIEKAIYESDLGLTPNNNGESIRIIIPALTEERRREFVKQVKVMTEEAKIAVRNLRRDLINDIKKDNLSEDEEQMQINRLQGIIDQYNKKIEDRFKEKEKDLLTV